MSTGDALMASVSGLRGTMGGSLTPEVVARFAAGFAGFVRASSGAGTSRGRPLLIVGHDGRAGAEAVYQTALGAARMAGCDVAPVGRQMTPTIGRAVDVLRAAGGLQVTASHNPQNWCGLKPIVRVGRARAGVAQACAASKAVARPLLERFNDGQPLPGATWDRAGSEVRVADPGDEHVRHVADLLDDLGALRAVKRARFKVAVDTVAGSAMGVTPRLLKLLGATGHELYPASKHDRGVFPHTPEPTRDNLRALARFAKARRAHAGFAQDPDADRLALVDERGSYIGEEYTLVLAAMALGELGGLKKGGVLCVNLSTSRMIEDVVGAYGCRVVRTAVGEANVVERMKAEGSAIGGEGNGGVIWPRVTYVRDSLSGMALTLGLLAWRGQSLSQVVAGIPRYAIVKRKVDLGAGVHAQEVLARAAKKYARHGPDLSDGVWVGLADQRAWLHVRASNTEPILRLIAEAPTQAQAEALLDEAGTCVTG
jgi:phosphomannomutase